MARPREATTQRETYDVIVVGGGLAGLTAAACLAKAGRAVLVAEREAAPGGFVREHRFGPYRVNPAIHAVMGGNVDGPFGPGVLWRLLQYLGVEHRCRFQPIDPFYRVHLPGQTFDVPTGREAFLDAHRRAFGRDADGIEPLYTLCEELLRETLRFPLEPHLRDYARMVRSFPRLLRNASSTLTDVMNRHLDDPRVKTAFAALWPYIGLPPDRVSILQWAPMLAGYVGQGAFYCEGGYDTLADAIVSGLREHGGELLLGAEVSEIGASQGRVTGVRLASGQVVRAPLVIATLDVRQVFGRLLTPGEAPARYGRRLDGLEPSTCVLGIHFATDLDLKTQGVPKVNLVQPWAPNDAWSAAQAGRVRAVGVHVPTVIDPSLAPAGEHLLVAQAFVPETFPPLSGPRRTAFVDALLDACETVAPGVRDHITWVQGADDSAETHPLHRIGPMYGLAGTPRQSGPRRLRNTTPIEGLLLAGHWTQPGHGVWTAAISGIKVAQMIRHEQTTPGLWPIPLP